MRCMNIESRENVIIMGHSLTDVDSLGAGIGIFCAARVLGKKAQIVINEPTTSIRPLMECFTPEKGYPEDMFINSEIAIEEVSRNYPGYGGRYQPAKLYGVPGTAHAHRYDRCV